MIEIPVRHSYISTSQPMLAKEMAERQPTGPAPTTTALRGIEEAVCQIGLIERQIGSGWDVLDDRICDPNQQRNRCLPGNSTSR
jgi:hypothetical protein